MPFKLSRLNIFCFKLRIIFHTLLTHSYLKFLNSTRHFFPVTSKSLNLFHYTNVVELYLMISRPAQKPVTIIIPLYRHYRVFVIMKCSKTLTRSRIPEFNRLLGVTRSSGQQTLYWVPINRANVTSVTPKHSFLGTPSKIPNPSCRII